MDTNITIGSEYVKYSRKRLVKEFLPRIERCLEILTEEEIWWRAHETDNSIGNLVLHLSGNARQWIVSGLGNVPDKRDRAKEFSERENPPKDQLLKILRETMADVDKTLEKLDVQQLLEIRHIQKYDVTCLDALSHVVEHFAQHLGQIIYITKLKKGVDLKFYNL
ncbi:MAG: DUF1572 family protein [Bacteroidota bacterium]